MTKHRVILIGVAFLASIILIRSPRIIAQNESIRFVFYNVENLFDLKNDSLTEDDEFTPEGDKKWTSKRYYDKIDRIARTITAVGEWEMPALVGLCEIENQYVLQDLVAHRLIADAGYEIIHKDSPDDRGIDVALLYAPEEFKPLKRSWLGVSFDHDPDLTTREILYVKGVVSNSDTLHLFINHWPSRWGGVEATIPKRVAAAQTLKKHTDSLFYHITNPNILIAGDLNDNPLDSSVFLVLGARSRIDNERDALYNLMFSMYENRNEGSLKYKGVWETYDQIIVSSALLNNNRIHIKDSKAYIFSAPYLLIEDERYLGQKPFRTYAGPQYLDGYSDHLPVYLDLMK